MSRNTEIEWSDSTWSPLRVRIRQDAAVIARAKGYTSLIQIGERAWPALSDDSGVSWCDGSDLLEPLHAVA